MSERGARDFVKGSLWSFLQNLSFIFPMIFVFLFLDRVIRPSLENEAAASLSYWSYIVAALILVLIMALVSYFQYNSTYLDVYTESGRRRIALAEKLRQLPLSYFGKKNLSDLTLTIMEDTTDLEMIFSHAVPQLAGSVLLIILAFFGMLSLSVPLTFALFWVVPVAFIIILLSKRFETRWHKNIYLKKRDVSEKIEEGLEQIQEIKSYGQEERYLNELNEEQDNYEKTQLSGELLLGIIINLTQAIIKLGIPTLVLVGFSLLQSGGVDLLTFLFFLLISAVIYEPLLMLLNNSAVLFHLDVRLERIGEILDMESPTGEKEYQLDNYDIEFDKVSFGYEKDSQVLDEVSFVAKQGEVTALIGPSGGGKSTTARLAARFWDADSGSVRIGGMPVKNIDPEALLKQFSIVFQDVVLFNASVLDNIRIGRKDATDEDVMKAAKMAQCDAFVKDLPNGYQTRIGENGSKLSGGERQRISIARALLKDAPVILLDEATASVDVENETEIQTAISTLIKDKTVLIIAHRMRTISLADHLVVLADGRVVEQGSPNALYEQKGMYYRMVQQSN